MLIMLKRNVKLNKSKGFHKRFGSVKFSTLNSRTVNNWHGQYMVDSESSTECWLDVITDDPERSVMKTFFPLLFLLQWFLKLLASIYFQFQDRFGQTVI